MQAEQTASIVGRLFRKPLVPSFPSKPCWIDMQTFVMSQCDCNGCTPLAPLLYGWERKRERLCVCVCVEEACQCCSCVVWCKRDNDHTEALEWQQPCVIAWEPPPPPYTHTHTHTHPHLPVCGGMVPRAEQHACVSEAPVSQPPSRSSVPLPPPVSRSGAHFVCSAYTH